MACIAHCFFRITVNFNFKPVCSCSNCALSQNRNHPPDSAGMAWVNNNRKMAYFMKVRNGTDVKTVAGIIIIRSYSAFAQNDVFVSICHNVFCAHQKFVYSSGKSSLQKDRFIRFSKFLEQIKILKIPRTNLN